MRIACFVIPVLDSVEAQEEVNRFLASHRVLTLDRELVKTSHSSFWALGITYVERPIVEETPKRSKVDYREKLSPEDFEVYAGLRALRKEIATRDGVPTYAIFNNAQLADMVQRQVRTRESLGQISGVGSAKIETHGDDFLTLLAELQAKSSGEKEL